MDVWVDVHTADAEGPVKPISISLTRALDGVGSIGITVAPYDRRALTLLQNERRVSMYIEEEGVVRLLGKGVIKKKEKRASGNGSSYAVDGQEGTNVLTDTSTFRNLSYNNETIEFVITDLLARADWTASFEPGLLNTTARFDGTSIFKAVAAICKQNGVHFRESLTVPNEMEIGHFGTSIDLRITTPPPSHDAMQSDDLAFITTITEVTKSEQIMNVIVPLGDGQGESALTLEKAVGTRSIALGYPYDIVEINVNGKTEYALKDQDSIDFYEREKQRYPTYPDIRVVENTDAGEIASANQLYDAAVADLQRMRFPQSVYKVAGIKSRKTIRAGDKVWVDYVGEVLDRNGDFIDFISVNEEFWVLRVTERASAAGIAFDLEISTIDAMPKDALTKIVEATERIQLESIKPGLTPFRQENTYTKPVQRWNGQPSYTFDATFQLKVDSTVTALTKVLINFKSSPLYTYAYTDGVGNFYNVIIDDYYPQDLSLWLNGVDVTTAVNGGVWNASPGNSPVDVELDITDYIKGATGGFRQTHTIEIRCSQQTRNVEVPGYGSPTTGVFGNHGIIEMVITVLGTAQSIITF